MTKKKAIRVLIVDDHAVVRSGLHLLLDAEDDLGLIVVDNLLWGGRIAAGDQDPDTQALRAFNERFLHHEQLEATILPVGDGLGIGVVRSHA